MVAPEQLGECASSGHSKRPHFHPRRHNTRWGFPPAGESSRFVTSEDIPVGVCLPSKPSFIEHKLTEFNPNRGDDHDLFYKTYLASYSTTYVTVNATHTPRVQIVVLDNVRVLVMKFSPTTLLRGYLRWRGFVHRLL